MVYPNSISIVRTAVRKTRVTAVPRILQLSQSQKDGTDSIKKSEGLKVRLKLPGGVT